MTRQKTAYGYSIDQCDVCDKAALAEFRDKRLLWLDWLNDDDVHAIWPQISSALWNDIAFRTIANMADGFPDSALHNSVLTGGASAGILLGPGAYDPTSIRSAIRCHITASADQGDR